MAQHAVHVINTQPTVVVCAAWLFQHLLLFLTVNIVLCLVCFDIMPIEGGLKNVKIEEDRDRKIYLATW